MPIIAYDPDGMRISLVGDDEYKKRVWQYIINLALKSETGTELLMKTIKSDKTFVIANTKEDYEPGIDNVNNGTYEVLAFNLSNVEGKYYKEKDGSNGKKLKMTVETTLAHEMAHFLSPVVGKLLTENGYQSSIHADEANGVEQENRVRAEMGLDQRTHHSGRNVYDKTAIESKRQSENRIKGD